MKNPALISKIKSLEEVEEFLRTTARALPIAPTLPPCTEGFNATFLHQSIRRDVKVIIESVVELPTIEIPVHQIVVANIPELFNSF